MDNNVSRHNKGIQYNPQRRDEFRRGVDSYRPKNPFNLAIYCGLFPNINELAGLKRSFRVGDFMSGPGKLGIEVIFETYKKQVSGRNDMPELELTFNDLNNDMLDRAVSDLAMLGGKGKSICCDVRVINLHYTQELDAVALRYGLKDLPKHYSEHGFGTKTDIQTVVALKSIYDVIAHGGRIVLGEMTAYTSEGQGGFVELHSGKQIISGTRNVAEEGMCHIPTIKEWNYYLGEAGFKDVKRIWAGGSHIKITTDLEKASWKGQFGIGVEEKEALKKMLEMAVNLADTNPTFAKESKAVIESEGGKVISFDFEFPIAVFTGVKR